MRLRWPVGLDWGEPFREESDDELRRMHPPMENAVDRRQAERRAKLIDRFFQDPIDQKPVGQSEERALEPHRLRCRNPHIPRHAGVDEAADDARLQMDGRRRHAEPLLRQAGAKRNSRSGDNGVRTGMPLDVPVNLGHGRQHRAARHDFESFARVPEVGVGDDVARILDGSADRKEPE